MSRPIAASPIVSPHSFQSCATLRACACSRSALVGMQPQLRHVPPRTGARSTTAVLRPSCAARMAATYPPVPEPITMTSNSLAITGGLRLLLPDGGERNERDRRGLRNGIGSPGFGLFRVEAGNLRAQAGVIVPELPIRLRQCLELACPPPRPRARPDREEQGKNDADPQGHNRRTLAHPQRFAFFSLGVPLATIATVPMAHSKTILICDDDQGMRDTIAAILKRDYRVLTVSSGEAAL